MEWQDTSGPPPRPTPLVRTSRTITESACEETKECQSKSSKCNPTGTQAGRGVQPSALSARAFDPSGALATLSDAVSTASSVVSAAFVLRDVVAKLSALLAEVEECESEESSDSDEHASHGDVFEADHGDPDAKPLSRPESPVAFEK